MSEPKRRKTKPARQDWPVIAPPKKSMVKRWTGILLLVALFLLIIMMPVLYFARFVTRVLAGWPVHVPFLLAGLVWTVVIFITLWCLFSLLRKHMRKHADEFRPPNMFDDIINALDRIAGGDYNVFIEPDERFYYGELGEKINHLASQLSSVEQMRQDFVSNVSHEFQSPLTSITGFAELLKNPDLTQEQHLHYVEVIESEAKRMSHLSSNLMKLSMLEGETVDFAPEPFRLDRQVENVLLGLEPQWAGKSIELDVDLCGVHCVADEELMVQVWQNLLHNAIKFTPEEGRISVTMRREENEIYCTVQDSGPGMEAEDLLHVFERFYKVDKARDRSLGGNGLGLPLAKKIVELHNGRISAHSEVGQGTAFTVVLPAGQPKEEV